MSRANFQYSVPSTQYSVPNTRPNRGIVLILVLVVVALLSLAAYTFCDLMVTEREAVLLHGEQLQARVFAESGVDMVRLYLTQDATSRATAGGHYDNPTQFQGVIVLDDEDANWRGRFTVIAPALDTYGYFSGSRYGLENESARLNLNALLLADMLDEEKQREVLMMLPGMTEDVADAILDWIDEDDEPREYGAEVEYYSMLDPSYAPTNGPLKTVEELLLVRGVMPELLFGMDANRNGVVDSHERENTTATAVSGLGYTYGEMDRGWAAYLTLYSAERNANSLGEPRIDLNAEDLELLHADVSAVLDADSATFIVAYRQNGPYQEEGSGGDQEQPDGGGDGGGDDGGGGGDEGRGDGGGGSGGGGGSSGGVSMTLSAAPSPGGGSSSPPGGASGGTGGGEAPSSGAVGGGQDGGGGAPIPEEDVDGREVDLAQPAKQEIEQVLDLIGAKVQVTFEGDDGPTLLRSPFPNDPDAMREYLPVLTDYLTANSETVIPGRVHVNEAPKAVLLAIPGMTEDIVEQIIAWRDVDPTSGDTSRQNETWLLAEGIVKLDQMKALMPFVTARGDVFRAQVVGYYDGAGVSARAEVIVDATIPLPRVVFWRELTHLGRGFTYDVLGSDVIQR